MKRRGAIRGDAILAKELNRSGNLLLGEYLAEGEHLLLYAPSGQGKTINALNLAVALTSGIDFYNWKSESKVPVLFVEGGELTAYGIGERLQAIYRKHRITSDPNFHLFAPTVHDPFIFDISNLEHQAELFHYIKAFEIKCVIFDNYNSLRREEESEFICWQKIERFLNQLKVNKVASVMVHHTNKAGKEQSGAQRKVDYADLVLRIQESVISTDSQVYIEVEMQKFRWGKKARKKLLKMKYNDNELELEEVSYNRTLAKFISADLSYYGKEYVNKKYGYLGHTLFHLIALGNDNIMGEADD